jgi:hypothetical protein
MADKASCLPLDAFQHFAEREDRFLKCEAENSELEAEKNRALNLAHKAMADVENLDFSRLNFEISED